MKVKRVKRIMENLLKHFPDTRMKTDRENLHIHLGVYILSLKDKVRLFMSTLFSKYTIEKGVDGLFLVFKL